MRRSSVDTIKYLSAVQERLLDGKKLNPEEIRCAECWGWLKDGELRADLKTRRRARQFIRMTGLTISEDEALERLRVLEDSTKPQPPRRNCIPLGVGYEGVLKAWPKIAAGPKKYENPCAEIPSPELAHPGYHRRPIPKGVYGQISKVHEEMLECEDAHSQHNPVMLIQELSDLVGAVMGWLDSHNLSIQDILRPRGTVRVTQWQAVLEKFEQARYYVNKAKLIFDLGVVLRWIEIYISQYNLTLQNLIQMAVATRRAFLAGHRRPNPGDAHDGSHAKAG
jgi:hypothetical protein